MLMIPDEVVYKILRKVSGTGVSSQREIAGDLGMSLGKVNYCLKALLEKGLIKVGNFRRSSNKQGYFYLLTAEGVAEKSRVTVRFLRRKLDEYAAIERELEELRQEVRTLPATEPLEMTLP
jgi:EPS-associated MarR family transcriptional regulator